MPVNGSVRSLRPEEAAYLAGLIDGEGTSTLSRLHKGSGRSIVVTISNTDRTLLQFVLDTVGSGCITSKRIYHPAHTPSFAYKIANRQALDLLAQVACYLKTYRAKRASLALTKYIAVTPRNGKYSSEIHRMKAEFEREFLAMGPGPRNGKRCSND